MGLRGGASALLRCVPRKSLFLRHELMRYGCDGAPALAVKGAFTDTEAGHNGIIWPPNHVLLVQDIVLVALSRASFITLGRLQFLNRVNQHLAEGLGLL